MNAIHNIWFLGDNFLKETFPAFNALVYQAQRNKQDAVAPYIHDYYNIKSFHNLLSGGVKLVIARIVNSLKDAINKKDVHLPKYLVVIPDKDPVSDVDVFHTDAVRVLKDITLWMV